MSGAGLEPASGEEVEEVEVSEDVEEVSEESVPGSAYATPRACPFVTSTPMPSATAKAPTRPINLLEPAVNVIGGNAAIQHCGSTLKVGWMAWREPVRRELPWRAFPSPAS